MNYLDAKRVNVGLRRSRGKDINAACGQLANKKWNFYHFHSFFKKEFFFYYN